MLVGESEGILRELIFACEGCAEHGGVIAVQRDHYAMIEVALYGMLVETGAEAGAEVAGETDFHRDLALGKLFDEIWIVEGSKRVADALGAKIERAPYGFRRTILASVGGQAHAVVAGPGIGVTKEFGRGFQFVASDADADDFSIMIMDGEFKDVLRGFKAKLANSVEDPEKRDSEVASAAGAAAIQAFEDGGEILLAPEADSDRNVNFGMQNVFFFQALHQAVGDELVIFWGAEMLGDVLEGEQKTWEIVVKVELVDLGLGDAVAVVAAEFEKCGGFDCSLEMQVEFGLRQLAEETAGRPNEC